LCNDFFGFLFLSWRNDEKAEGAKRLRGREGEGEKKMRSSRFRKTKPQDDVYGIK